MYVGYGYTVEKNSNIKNEMVFKEDELEEEEEEESEKQNLEEEKKESNQ